MAGIVLPPDQEDLLQQEFATGDMPADKAAAYQAYLLQKPQLPLETPTLTARPTPPPPAPAAPKPPALQFPPGDPRNDSPWYQSTLEKYALGTGLPDEGTPWGPPVLGTTAPGEQADARKEYQETLGTAARLGLEGGASLLPMTWPGRVGSTAAKWGPWVWETAKELVPRAIKSGLTSGGATMVANVLDPATYTPPWEAVAWNAGGEALGGVAEDVLKGTGAYLRRPWQETSPWGTVHRQVIEGAGGQVTPAMVTERKFPQLVENVLMHTPAGGRTEDVYTATRGKLQQEMKALQGQHPGGKVTTEVADLNAQVQAHALHGAVNPTAEEIRGTTARVIKETEAKHVQSYADLDAFYRQQPVNWGASQPRLPAVTKPEDLLTDPRLMTTHQIGPTSLFHQTAQMVEAMRNLPPTVTVDTLIDMQKTVEKLMLEGQKHIDEALELQKTNPAAWTELTTSIQKNVLGALADTNHLLYTHLKDFMVDRGPAQEVAKGVIGNWEKSAKVPESAMQKGGPGRVGVLEDPQVMAARSLLEKPRYALFSEAHQDRSQLLKIGRVPGANMGNEIAREANEMAQALDVALEGTGSRLHGGQHAPAGSLEARRRHANAAYKEDAQVLNSPLMQELADKNLDDIINTFVQTNRANDMKTLRATLGKNRFGQDVMDDGAQMWLTKQIEEFTDEHGTLDHAGLLKRLREVKPEAAQALFPGQSLAGVRNRLSQGVDMEAAVKEVRSAAPDYVKLQQMKTRINDPQLWQAVQSDVLAPLLKGDVDPLSGAALLDGLKAMGTEVTGVLFTPAHLQALQHLGHTVRALDQAGTHIAYAPMIRKTAYGLAILGLGAYTGGTDAPMFYMLGAGLMSRALASPKVVQLLTRGLTTNPSKHAWGEVIGSLMGELYSLGLSNEVVPVSQGGQLPPQRPAAGHHPEDLGPEPPRNPYR